MNVRKIAALTGLALSTLPALASGASAQMYNGNDVFKVERNGQAIVYIGEQTPGADVPVTFIGADRTRRVSANACGLIILRSSPTAPLSGLKSVDGVTINQATLPTRLIPRCLDGTLEEPRTADFKTATGDVVIVKTPNTSYNATYTADVIRNIRANACGFATLRGSTSAPLMGTTQVKIGNDTPTTISAIPITMNEPICRNGTLFTPTGMSQ
ncbi:hypothetical protein [Leptolyngbya sp. FACHB-17]|uniref:hypothetical protein n=1 Tax=unclassified Leptolyngbya TaxID=2650499 RepID=UPI001681052B|nr:hypothetical protein [Leptolyngbya sp. FACHB-17]MBD2078459.1 hypothetical protein [Leptolyngbya sp. FACHB-17]